MLRHSLLTILLVIGHSYAWGINEARLISKSDSGRTVLFNLGIHDGIQEGDFGVVVRQVKPLEERDLRVVAVARARNVKIDPNSSVWILYQVMRPDLIRPGEKYLVLSESALLSGRRDPRFGRLTVVDSEKSIGGTANKALKHDKDRLAKLKEKYPAVTPLHAQELRTDGDGTLIDLERWKKTGSQRHRSSLYTSPHKEEFSRALKLETFEKLVTAYLKKVNDPNFSYDTFYAEQLRDVFSNEFRSRSNFDTEYESFLRDRAQQSTADARLYQAVLEKGESWSEDFSDEELRLILGRVSTLQEQDRRGGVISRPLRYAVALDYGLFLTDAQSKSDARGRQDARYSLEGEVEVTPFITHGALERFTLTAALRRNQTGLETNAINASVNEISAAFGANWYPWSAPYVVERPVVYLGTFLRSGFARFEAPVAREEANYTLVSIPGLRGGVKYFLRQNLGLRIMISMETLRFERYEANRVITLALPDRTNLVEGKFGFGLTYLF